MFEAELLAVTSAVFFALSSVTARRGLVTALPLAALLVNLIVGSVFFALMLPWILPPNPWHLTALGIFALSGISATTVGRLLQFRSIERMGAAASAPVANTFPLFSSLIAIGLLGESVTVPVAAGTALTIVGLMVLSSEGARGQWARRFLLVPLASAIAFGVGTAIRKPALALLPFPLFGVAVNTWAALATLLLLGLPLGLPRHVAWRQRGSWFFAGSGVFDSLALITLFASLNLGLVTIVVPLSSISPLFIPVLGHFLLRRLEVVRRRVVLGAVLVVSGVVLVTAA